MSERPQGQVSRLLAVAALVVAAVLIAAMVLTPQATVPDLAIRALTRLFGLVPGVGGGPVTSTLVQVGLNVLLFVPLGAALTLLRRPHGVLWATGVGFWVSVGLETAQALFLSERSAQTADVFANTVGCAVGYVLALVVLRRWRTFPA